MFTSMLIKSQGCGGTGWRGLMMTYLAIGV
jgi:hypothetical protein